MGAYEDLFMSHSSWFSYSSTSRIYKHYDFNLDDPATAAKSMSFSSYPGILSNVPQQTALECRKFVSIDHIYRLPTGLEKILNLTLFEKVLEKFLNEHS